MDRLYKAYNLSFFFHSARWIRQQVQSGPYPSSLHSDLCIRLMAYYRQAVNGRKQDAYALSLYKEAQSVLSDLKGRTTQK